MILAKELTALMSRRNMQQKEISVDTKIPRTTLSGYVKRGSVPIEKAAKIAEMNGDSLFVSQIAYKALGFIKSMDGSLSNVSEAELDIFQKMESQERKERKERVQQLIVESKVRSLDSEELEEVENYGLEFLDEIVVELAIVFKIFDVVHLDIRDAVKLKMPQWVAKHYMRGE